MARFEGRKATRPDLFVVAVVGALLLAAVVLLIWSLADPAGFTAYRESLLAPVRR